MPKSTILLAMTERMPISVAAAKATTTALAKTAGDTAAEVLLPPARTQGIDPKNLTPACGEAIRRRRAECKWPGELVERALGKNEAVWVTPAPLDDVGGLIQLEACGRFD
jgi:hypothetical protein